MSLKSTSRRNFIKTMGVGSTAMLLQNPLNMLYGNNVQPTEAKPNVLFISIDDLNDWINCMGGHPGTITPNLDRLAQRGLLFSNAHCPAPLCNASRTSLFTGVRPSTSGIYYNNQRWRQALPDAVTIPQHFTSNGYFSAGCGKLFHHGKHAFDAQSWQDYYPDQSKYPEQCMPDHPKHPDWRPGHPVPKGAGFPFGPIDVTDEEMSDWQVTDWAISQLNKTHEKPFFLACGIFRPHLAWFAPQKYFDMYPIDKIKLPNVNENDLDDVPPIARKWAKPDGDHRKMTSNNHWRGAVQAYQACITFADACVGRLIDALDQSPHAKNTIIVLWSDHGWHLGEKLHWRKFALWEEATHNPLMFVAPGITKPGSICDKPVNLIDIYPTLNELCNLPEISSQEGVSLLPLLRNPDKEWDRPALTTYGRNNHSIRSQRWRYTSYSDGTEELYDHNNDQLEWENLADDPKYNHVKMDLSKWLPKINAADAPRIKPKKS
jgi:arylsulfatase A-like enzyme